MLLHAAGGTRDALLCDAPIVEPLRRSVRVLHVEDSQDDAELVMQGLRRGGFDPICRRVDNRLAFKDALRTEAWDVILSDYSLPNYNGLTALADSREEGRRVPFILVSGTIGETGAVDMIRAGAQDYVLKDRLDRLPLAVEREMRETEHRRAQQSMSEQLAISERMASAGMLASGVAHEINNPLAVILGNVDFLTSLLGQLSADVRSLEPGRTNAALDARLSDAEGPLHDAREAAERIRGIVRDVMLFSRAQNAERAPVDVRTVIESSIRMAWNEIRHRAHVVKVYGDVPLVDSNEARLGQIFLNLFVNAAQAMPEGRASENEIRIVTKLDGTGRVIINVRDTGSGMPKEILARVFDPFFTTKAVGVGTGLGLSLCHRMVTDLGGEIGVESEVGKGTTFRVTLPVATETSRAAPQVKAVQEPTRRARVLVIDDEVAIGRTLVRGLGRFHEVVALTSGKEALARIAAGERFDAILSDLMMPEVTGMEIHEELTRIAPDQASRMVFITGGAFTERARVFLDRITNPRIEKPFQMESILAIIAGAPAR